MAATGNLQSIINVILSSFIDPLIPIFVGLAIIIFAWGLFNYLKSGIGEKAQIEGAKSLMFWGVVIIFVMVSVWGLVAILQNIFFGDDLPTVEPEINHYGLSV
jgi:heme A synthase